MRKLIIHMGVVLGLLCSFRSWASTTEQSRALDQFIRGTVADQMEDRYRAIFHYQEALRNDSTSAFIYVALAQDYLLLGNPSSANDLLNHALRLHPDNIPALELKLVIERGSGKFSEAQSLAKTLVKLSPKNVNYLRQLLAIEVGLKNFSGADKLRTEIESLEGQTGDVSRQLLGIYLTGGETKRAIAILQQLIAKDSTDSGLLYALGTCQIQLGDTVAGEQMLRKALALDPKDVRDWIGLAVLSMDQHRFINVLAITDSAAKHVPLNANLLSLKGAALQRLNRNAEALAALTQAVTMDSSQVAAAGTVALIYDAMDSVSQAVTWYEKTIRTSDSAAIYLNNLAYTLATHNLELERARTLSDLAIKGNEKNGAYLDTRGWIEFLMGDNDAALDWLKRASKQSPQNATIFEHIGDVLTKDGDARKAEKYYRKALELEPDNSPLRKKLAP
jgi:tetratricopeptide (TPR) repeat protein